MKSLEDIIGNRVELKVKHIKLNSVLAFPIFDERGNLKHPANKPFTEQCILRLLNQGIESVFYTKPKTIQKSLKEYLENKTYQGPRAIQQTTQQNALHIMEKIYKLIQNNEQVDYQEIAGLMGHILKDLKSSDGVLINLLDIENYDDYTYSHSLNVGIIAMLFAQHVGLEEDKVIEIGKSGFLHDIGKAKIPIEITIKPDKLTPEEFKVMQKHPELGYELIKDDNTISDFIKQIVLNHHEKENGTGYPSGLSGDEITEAIGVVGISDYFDAITTNRPYRRALTTKEALKVIKKNAKGHFKFSLVHRFIEKMNIVFKESQFYPVDSYLLLNTNEIAKVVIEDKKTVFYPTVEILTDRKGRMLKNPMQINLHNDYDRYIAYRIK